MPPRKLPRKSVCGWFCATRQDETTVPFYPYLPPALCRNPRTDTTPDSEPKFATNPEPPPPLQENKHRERERDTERDRDREDAQKADGRVVNRMAPLKSPKRAPSMLKASFQPGNSLRYLGSLGSLGFKRLLGVFGKT